MHCLWLIHLCATKLSVKLAYLVAAFGLCLLSGYADLIRVPHDATTVQEGLDSLSTNDTLIIDAGVYREVLYAPALRFWMIGLQDGDSVGSARTVIDATDVGDSAMTPALIIPVGAIATIERISFRNRVGPGIQSWADSVFLRDCRIDSVGEGFRQVEPDVGAHISIERCSFRANSVQCLSTRSGNSLYAEACVFTGGNANFVLVAADRATIRFCQFTSHVHLVLLVLGDGPHLVSGCSFGPATAPQWESVVKSDAEILRFENNVFLNCNFGYAALRVQSELGDSVEIVGNSFISCRVRDDTPSASGALNISGGISDIRGPLIEGNLFVGCSGVSAADDIDADWHSPALIRDNIFRNDGHNSLPSIVAGNPDTQPAPLTLINNRWEDCGYAVDLSAAADARDNYWGHNSGPYHAEFNPDGQGDTITGNVPFIPWLIDSTDAADDPVIVPNDFALVAYPNPFNAATTLQYTLAQRSHVSLKIFDLLGREVATLMNEVHEAGTHEVEFDGAALASSIYFARLETPQASRVTRLLLLK